MKTASLLLTTTFGVFAFGTAASADVFTFTGSETSFTVPTTGIYDITASGAQGGSGNGGTGGLGAEIGGDFDLTAGAVLTILVGGAGNTGIGIPPLGAAGGGGGGSFVATSSNTPLVVAGGGGGAGGDDIFPSNGDGGVTTTSGHPSVGGGVSGGSNGSGGSGNGGGGFSGNGAAGGAKSFLNGGAGGSDGGGNGGFGGGGAGNANFVSADNTTLFLGAGGGGGGYSGGGGAGLGVGGGGGGSFLDSSATNQVLTADENTGNGQVDISLVSATSAPEPGSLALFGSGLGLFAITLRWRRHAAATAAPPRPDLPAPV